MRYLGEVVVSLKGEARWNVSGRRSLVAFSGVGGTGSSLYDVTATDLVGSAGAGFRYLLARSFGLRAGIDVARSPEDRAYYVTIGTTSLRP